MPEASTPPGFEEASVIGRAVPVLVIALGALIAPFVATPTATAAIIPCNERSYRDLNGDGYKDAVVGDPYATVEGKVKAGTVTVLFGNAVGRIGEGARRVLTQRDFDETPEAGDYFGWAVGLSPFASSCYRILVGAPGEDVDGHPDAGMAHLITINAGRPEDPAELEFTENVVQSDVGGTVEDDDEFGFALAAHPDNAEYEPEIAFGAPGENNDAGVVNVSAGVLTSGVQERQGSRGVPGQFQARDRFGEVVGYFDYLPRDIDDPPALFVGAPGDVVNGRAGAGSVTVLQGATRRLITQNTSGIPGKAEADDHFGASLANNQLPPLRIFRQVAIGAPGEDLGSAKDAGSVTVLRRTDERIYPVVSLTQSTKGVAGTAETGDQFGAAVAYRDDRTLAIGIPGEDLGSVADAGSVQIVRVGKSNLSFPSPSITEDSPGTPGSVAAGSRFGSGVTGLAATDEARVTPPGGFGEAVFAITSGQAGGSVYVISSDSTVPPRSWQPGAGGIPGPGVRFGQSVS